MINVVTTHRLVLTSVLKSTSSARDHLLDAQHEHAVLYGSESVFSNQSLSLRGIEFAVSTVFTGICFQLIVLVPTPCRMVASLPLIARLPAAGNPRRARPPSASSREWISPERICLAQRRRPPARADSMRRSVWYRCLEGHRSRCEAHWALTSGRSGRRSLASRRRRQGHWVWFEASLRSWYRRPTLPGRFTMGRRCLQRACWRCGLARGALC